MKLARTYRLPLVWLLYACVLLASLSCSISHGQAAGLQLSGLSLGDCGENSGLLDGGSLMPSGMTLMGEGCVLCTTFSALILAALFGLLGRLPIVRGFVMPPWRLAISPRQGWPPSNPRASPFLA